MKFTLLPAIAAAFAALTFSAPRLPAQDDAPQAQPVQDDESGQEPGGEFDAGEFKKRMKEEEKETNAAIQRMMKVFRPLAGEWTGTEKVEHRDERFKALDKEWKDEWKGFFTVEGRYFEMTGATQGEESTTYRWVCTWDVKEEAYKAWYFGETSQTLYTGQLSQDGKYVTWTVENDENGSQTRFSMIPDGDRVKCSGTDRLGGQLFSRQSSSYTRKKVEL
jgi:hypothetical protein